MGAKSMNFVSKTRSFVLKTRDFVSKTRNFVLKTRDFVLKTMNFAADATASGASGDSVCNRGNLFIHTTTRYEPFCKLRCENRTRYSKRC